MFGEVLSRIDGWLGRSFVLARYFPWLLFFAANAVLAALEFPAVRAYLLAGYTDVSAGKRIVDLTLVLGLIAVIAFTLSPAVQTARRVLEGDRWPSWIGEKFLYWHARRKELHMHRYQDLFQVRARLNPDVLQKELIEARHLGGRGGRVRNVYAVEHADETVRILEASAMLNRLIGQEDLERAAKAVAAALRENCAEADWVPSDERASAERLSRVHARVLRVAEYAKNAIHGREERALEAWDQRFGEAELAPTHFGNEVAALRNYCASRYGFDFDFVWPRLRLTLKDEKLAESLDRAEAQVDYSVLCLALTVVFFVFWLLVMAFAGDSLWTLAGLVTFGPLAIFVWLSVLQASFSAFAGVVRAIVDVRRFDLLEGLRSALPSDSAKERALWARIERRLAANAKDVVLVYRAPG
jgi:hypothetical protein